MGVIYKFRLVEISPLIPIGNIFSYKINKHYKYKTKLLLSNVFKNAASQGYYNYIMFLDYSISHPTHPSCKPSILNIAKNNPVVVYDGDAPEIRVISENGNYINGLPFNTAFTVNADGKLYKDYRFNLRYIGYYPGTTPCHGLFDFDLQHEHAIYNEIYDYTVKVNVSTLINLINNYNPDPSNYIFSGVDFVSNDGQTIRIATSNNFFNYLAIKASKVSSTTYEENIRSLELLLQWEWLDENDNNIVEKDVSTITTGIFFGTTVTLNKETYRFKYSDISYLRLVYSPKKLKDPVTTTELNQRTLECDANNPCPSGYTCINGECVKIDSDLERTDSFPDSQGLISYKLPNSVYSDDQIDIIYLPSSVQIRDANGTYIGDAPYDQVDGLVVSHNGVFYYPNVRITYITNSFNEADVMEFVQYTKFDSTPLFKEGQLVYGVIYGQVKFGGFIESVTYSIKNNEQIIKYYAVGFRKYFENSPWVFNYTDYNVSSKSIIIKIVNSSPKLYCRDIAGDLPDFTLYKVNFNNATIGNGLSYIFKSAGIYAWYLGFDKIFKVYDLTNLSTKNLYVHSEGESVDSNKYTVIDLNVNYNLSDRITRLVIRGDYKRDEDGAIMTDESGNPLFLIYDTGWVGSAYTDFGVKNIKTLVDDRFKYIEGQRDDTGDLKKFAELYIAPYKDAYIGGSCVVDGVKTDLSIGYAVKIDNTNLSYLQNKKLIIQKVKYNLENKTTELVLTSNYWFGTDLTDYFATLEDRIDALAMAGYKETTEEYGIAVGKVLYVTKPGIEVIGYPTWVITIQDSITNQNRSFYAANNETVTRFQGYANVQSIKPGHYIQIHYSIRRYYGNNISFKYNLAALVMRIS